jgi:carbon starvation protein CstA
MITFWSAVLALIAGYLVYGGVVERLFGVDNSRPTPTAIFQDGVDYVPMSGSRIFLIQFLNIAGIGPIFGAIAGAQWGPVAYLWIVLGTIFAGGVHDFFSGMMSLRNRGWSISEIVGQYLGPYARVVMILFSIVLLILVGIVFVRGPADLLHDLTGIRTTFLVILIFGYYLLATVLPIDKLIGRVYPLFGLALLIMAVGLIAGIMAGGYHMPELTLANLHPKGMPVFPFLFITIACGAISGFHATQSPLMARCLKEEKQGRRIFYGAMVAEGIVAMVWAAVSMSFFGTTADLAQAGSAAVVVNKVSVGLLGTFGGALAILGVVACPITSGDTAFRSSRLIIADAIGLPQKKISTRFLIAVPVFLIAIGISLLNFNVIWRYFAWSNQTLAMIVLWTGSAFLVREGRPHWLTTVPAVFMSAVTMAYILQASEGFRISASVANAMGILFAGALLAVLLFSSHTGRRKMG